MDEAKELTEAQKLMTQIHDICKQKNNKKEPRNLYVIVCHLQTKKGADPRYSEFKTIENVYLETNLKDKHLTSAALIFEVFTKKVIINRLKDETEEAVTKRYLEEHRLDIMNFYMSQFGKIINLTQWD